MFLRQHDLGNRAAVHGEGLEELWTGSHRLRMLHYDTHRAWTSAIRDLDPVPTVTWTNTRFNRNDIKVHFRCLSVHYAVAVSVHTFIYSFKVYYSSNKSFSQRVFRNCAIHWITNSLVLVEYGLVLCATTPCEMTGWRYLFWASGRHSEQ